MKGIIHTLKHLPFERAICGLDWSPKGYWVFFRTPKMCSSGFKDERVEGKLVGCSSIQLRIRKNRSTGCSELVYRLDVVASS